MTKAAAKTLSYRLELGSRTNRLTLVQAAESFKSHCPGCNRYHMTEMWITRYTDKNGAQYDYCQECAPW